MMKKPLFDPVEQELIAAYRRESRSTGRYLFPLVVVVLLVAIVASMLPALARSREVGCFTACKYRPRVLGLSFKMYANDHAGLYPPFERAGEGVWMRPRLETTGSPLDFYPNYGISPYDLLCAEEQIPETETVSELIETIGTGSFWYLGHQVDDEESLSALIAAFQLHDKSRDIFLDENYVNGWVETPYGHFQALRDTGLTREDQASIPVLIERPTVHKLQDVLGGNVLFLDGHVEFREYPGRFPYTEAIVEALRALDAPDE